MIKLTNNSADTQLTINGLLLNGDQVVIEKSDSVEVTRDSVVQDFRVVVDVFGGTLSFAIVEKPVEKVKEPTPKEKVAEKKTEAPKPEAKVAEKTVDTKTEAKPVDTKTEVKSELKDQPADK